MPFRNAIKADSLKFTDSTGDKILTLPCSTSISDEDLEKNSKNCTKYVVKYGNNGFYHR